MMGEVGAGLNFKLLIQKETQKEIDKNQKILERET